MKYNFQLSERLFFLARPEGKSSGSGHDWPLRTDLSRITQLEETISAQAVRSSYKIRVTFYPFRKGSQGKTGKDWRGFLIFNFWFLKWQKIKREIRERRLKETKKAQTLACAFPFPVWSCYLTQLPDPNQLLDLNLFTIYFLPWIYRDLNICSILQGTYRELLLNILMDTHIHLTSMPRFLSLEMR